MIFKKNKKKKPHPVVCEMVFGSPGCGKTTYAARLVSQSLEKYDYSHIYTNFACRGAERVSVSDIGSFDLSHSLIIIDEAGIDLSNRDWKKTQKTLIDYLKLHRHYSSSFVFLSQSWEDADKKIRDLCSVYRLLSRGPFGLTWIRNIAKFVMVDENHQIIEGFDKVPVLRGGLRCFRRPHWYGLFDSWSAPPLPPFVSSPW